MQAIGGLPYHDAEFDVSAGPHRTMPFDAQNDKDAHSRARRGASNAFNTPYMGYHSLAPPAYRDHNAYSSVIEPPKFPTSDGIGAIGAESGLGPQYVAIRQAQEEEQMLDYSQILETRVITVPRIAQDAVLAPPNMGSWNAPFVHQPQPRKPHTGLSTRIDPQPTAPKRSAPSFLTLVDGRHPITASSPSQTNTLRSFSSMEQPSTAPSSPLRRRKSSHASPTSGSGADSARAISLEKNRNAASKCRNKQKKEQDDLVEAARDMETTNKILKAKVAILQEELGELMVVVSQHGECADKRLLMYAKRISGIEEGDDEMR